MYGLWHLGTVTAACLAQDTDVIAVDADLALVNSLARGEPPVDEPGLDELIQSGLATERLRFGNDIHAALEPADILWVTFDTPVDDDDRPDVDWLRNQLAAARPFVRSNTLVVLSTQVPAGFSRRLEREWRTTDPSLQFAYIPENLRLGDAIQRFRHPDFLVVGLGQGASRERLTELVDPFATRIHWMSLESAEMSKHALNGFLAVSATYANELARVCEAVGADAHDVENALRADPRVGRRAYVAPGGPIAGGTLGRDINVLRSLARENGVGVPVLDAVPSSNATHQAWVEARIHMLLMLLTDAPAPRVALLGLTYKTGTNTLRRSFAVQLARRLIDRGMEVRAFDPAIHAIPAETGIYLAPSLESALDGADVAVLMTPWPEFKGLQATDFVGHMRHPRVVDQTGFLAHIDRSAGLTYVRLGQPRPGSDVR